MAGKTNFKGIAICENRETYGADLKENIDSEPDLILVCNENGVQGYIRTSDIESNPKTIEEVFSLSDREFEINLYFQDGGTFIG